MGIYINQNSKGEFLPTRGKAEALIADGAKEVDGKEFLPDMVCVVDNDGKWDAALYCEDEIQYMRTVHPSEYRKRRWLIYPNLNTQI